MDNNLDIEIYNKSQKWWVNIKENCKGSINQLEDSIKLQKEIQLLAETKIKELK